MSDVLCTVAEGLIGARAAGVLRTEPEQVLLEHLASSSSCRRLAAEIEAPIFSEAVAQASLTADFDEPTVVPADRYRGPRSRARASHWKGHTADAREAAADGAATANLAAARSELAGLPSR